MSEEIILLGDPVVYRDDLKGFDSVGVVTRSNGSSLQVLWNDEHHSRTEQYDRLRPASLAEVDTHCRIISKGSD
ncbi:phosphohistidine phosphatase [Acinetobacter bereziniae]|uniref:phosphohistidine phosphatase n=1 Tax=Acinetobacter bereziniae TaxID=106648 RepID=UPI00225B2319|nr:phosphohistidine phosphatase [Acinetobacter bereziniae]